MTTNKDPQPPELVERVAKAIYETAAMQAAALDDVPRSDYGEWSQVEREEYRVQARAALAALSALPQSEPAGVVPDKHAAAWTKLGQWLTDRELGPDRAWDYCKIIPPAIRLVLNESCDEVAVGEGPTLDEALIAALEKMK